LGWVVWVVGCRDAWVRVVVGWVWLKWVVG